MTDTKIISPWRPDATAFDPSVIVCTVEVDGRTFTVRNVLGPGWSMFVSPTNSPLHVGEEMVGWEDWAAVAAAARRCVAFEQQQYMALRDGERRDEMKRSA